MKKIKWLFVVVISLFITSCSLEKEKELDDSFQNVLSSVDTDYFVNYEEVGLIANSFSSKETVEMGFKDKVLKEIIPIKDEEDKVIFYISNYHEGGFFILAADKRSIPVLAYSFDNNFSLDEEIGFPHGLIDWLQFAKEQIQEIRTKNLEQPIEFIEYWDVTKAGVLNPTAFVSSPCNQIPTNTVFKAPLLTTAWHQRASFNDFMPLAVPQYCSNIGTSNNRFYAGCVPIAIAQVMRYHQYPANFDYNAMDDLVGTYASKSLINDIHHKIYYFYDKFNPFFTIRPLKYRCESTGVSSDFPVHSLLKLNYRYSTANTMSSAFIIEPLMLNDILQNRPVILSGGRAKGWWIFKQKTDGHMWVADGVDKTTFCIKIFGKPTAFTVLRYNMNWGWGGLDNAFYSYGNFNPGSASYNYQVELVYNIKP
ncbi:C10 family peptidase [Myroides indicus]|uniref:Peptidase C10-like protein n=1 Tax=Myroides indicus TaxID=1323422 RepID=A0A4R7ERQ3_9FLAO|nr:C10 family peptidase [Myroides indicus]TDS53983.1 peptidase C10-like protein [Myroides indicus]